MGKRQPIAIICQTNVGAALMKLSHQGMHDYSDLNQQWLAPYIFHCGVNHVETHRPHWRHRDDHHIDCSSGAAGRRPGPRPWRISQRSISWRTWRWISWRRIPPLIPGRPVIWISVFWRLSLLDVRRAIRGSAGRRLVLLSAHERLLPLCRIVRGSLGASARSLDRRVAGLRRM
jgi:hypothetical protein